MEAESEKFEIEELVLLVAFAVIVIALSFGLGWYAKGFLRWGADKYKFL